MHYSHSYNDNNKTKQISKGDLYIFFYFVDCKTIDKKKNNNTQPIEN